MKLNKIYEQGLNLNQLQVILSKLELMNLDKNINDADFKELEEMITGFKNYLINHDKITNELKKSINEVLEVYYR